MKIDRPYEAKEDSRPDERDETGAGKPVPGERAKIATDKRRETAGNERKSSGRESRDTTGNEKRDASEDSRAHTGKYGRKKSKAKERCETA
jgi:hypothetical protein